MNEREAFVRQFRELQPKFARFFTRRLTQAKISFPQFALLSQLSGPAGVSMTEVGRKLHISKPAVTHLVDRLEKNKFLVRVPHREDRRVSLLQILPKGGKLVRAVQTQALGFLLKTLGGFDADERKTIARFYSRLSQTLDRELEATQEMRK